MASKFGRKGRSKTTCPEKERNMEHQTHLGLSPSSKTLPTILSDTSPQEEMAEETRQLTNKSEADFNSEEVNLLANKPSHVWRSYSSHLRGVQLLCQFCMIKYDGRAKARPPSPEPPEERYTHTSRILNKSG